MTPFRKLMVVVLCSGALAGLVLFTLQHFTLAPLIAAAERYEREDHHHAEWKPADGLERTAWTAVTSVLTGIGFAGLLFGFLGITGRSVTARQGLLWGLAAFVCFHLAPALGLPPVPPGVPEAGLQHRQLWWVLAVVATAAGLWLLSKRMWLRAIAGVACLLAPHLIGAPAAVAGEVPVPAELLRNFALASLATTAIAWPLLGATGGFLSTRMDRERRA